MDPATATLWWAGKEFFRDQTVGDRCVCSSRLSFARTCRPAGCSCRMLHFAVLWPPLVGVLTPPLHPQGRQKRKDEGRGALAEAGRRAAGARGGRV